MRQVRVYLADPEFRAGECTLKFTLTYEGQLATGKRHVADRKHVIRKGFHKQLQRLWAVHPMLSNWFVRTEDSRGLPHEIQAKEWIAGQMPSLGNYRFVPLITNALCVESALELRVLRPTDKKGVVSDIDNQIKVLLDTLKMPGEMNQLGTYDEPDEDEHPFFVLAQDDGLITKISSVNDELLQPILGKTSIDPADVRVFVDVYIRPQLPNALNIRFFSDDNAVWDHRYDDAIPENLTSISNSQLKAIATQLIFRIRALSDSFSSWQAGSISAPREDWNAYTAKIISDSALQKQIWHDNLWPKAVAIKSELCRRIYGEPPYPSDDLSVAIDHGMLAGANPLSDAATELDSLVRRLP